MNKILTKCFLSIDGAVMQGQTTVAISLSAESGDVTGFGSEFRERIGGGVKDWGFSAEFNATPELATTLFGKVGTVVEIEARPSDGAVSVGNPAFVGPVVITECDPLDGTFGEVWTITLTGEGAGTLELLTVAAI